MKRDREETFDVDNGVLRWCRGMQTCWRLYSDRLTTTYSSESLGLYRNDGLGVLRNISGPEADRIRKHVVQVFKECNLASDC